MTFPRGDWSQGQRNKARKGSFNIQTGNGLVQGVSHRYCTVVQRGNGYGYSLVAKTDVTGTPPQHRGASHPALYLPGLKAEVSRAN